MKIKEVSDDKLSIDSITLKDSSTIIKGAKKYIKNVAVVKALVDVDKFSSQESGTFTLKDVPLKAYDENGDVVDVELVPSVMDVDVTLSESKKQKILSMLNEDTTIDDLFDMEKAQRNIYEIENKLKDILNQ